MSVPLPVGKAKLTVPPTAMLTELTLGLCCDASWNQLPVPESCASMYATIGGSAAEPSANAGVAIAARPKHASHGKYVFRPNEVPLLIHYCRVSFTY
jgi:hypothetical protein